MCIGVNDVTKENFCFVLHMQSFKCLFPRTESQDPVTVIVNFEACVV